MSTSRMRAGSRKWKTTVVMTERACSTPTPAGETKRQAIPRAMMRNICNRDSVIGGASVAGSGLYPRG